MSENRILSILPVGFRLASHRTFKPGRVLYKLRAKASQNPSKLVVAFKNIDGGKVTLMSERSTLGSYSGQIDVSNWKLGSDPNLLFQDGFLAKKRTLHLWQRYGKIFRNLNTHSRMPWRTDRRSTVDLQFGHLTLPSSILAGFNMLFWTDFFSFFLLSSPDRAALHIRTDS